MHVIINRNASSTEDNHTRKDVKSSEPGACVTEQPNVCTRQD